MPTSAGVVDRSRMSRRASRGGFSLVEVLVVLAITALTAALVFPLGGRLLDRISVHTAFFAIQQQLLDARREAFRDEVTITFEAEDREGAEGRRFVLPEDWSYEATSPLVVSPDGGCSLTQIRISHRRQEIALLEGRGTSCRLTRIR